MNLRQQILRKNDCYIAGWALAPKGVMIHSTGADNPNVRRYVPGDNVIGYNTGGNHWNRPGLEKCVHAFVGKFADGSVGTVQTLPWDMRGWHAGKGKNGSANNTHIGFEICEDGLEDTDYFQAVYREAVELTAYLCEKFDLDPLAGGVVICHKEGHQRGVASNHGDVLHWFPQHGKNMDDFRADVVKHLRGEEEPELTEEQVRKVVRDEYAKIEAERAALPASEWAKPYIQKAIDGGAMDQNETVTIDRPLAYVTREEMAVIVAALLN